METEEESAADSTAIEETSVTRKKVASSQSWWSRLTGFFKRLFGRGDESRKTGRVTSTTGLTMRDGPGTGNRDLGAIPAGSKVDVLDARDGWFKVGYQDENAWVSGRYLSVEGREGTGYGSDDEVGESGEDKGEPGYVNVPKGLNVRSSPEKGDNRIHVFSSGTVVSILEEKNGWKRVCSGTTEGWVYGKCVSSGKPPSTLGSGSLAPGDEVYVNTPLRTQYDPVNGEYQSSWCGPTVLGMIYEQYGRKETTKAIADRVYNYEARMGTYVSDLVKDAREHGFPDTEIRTGVDFDYIKENLEAGRPVIVGVEVAWKSGHYMVVVGLEGDKIIVNDPGRKKVRREFTRSWFLTQWNGRHRRAIVLK